jgi:hypothetical protein
MRTATATATATAMAVVWWFNQVLCGVVLMDPKHTQVKAAVDQRG